MLSYLGFRTCASPSPRATLLRSRDHARTSDAATRAPAIVSEALAAPGQSLDALTQRRMEAALGFDFSRVRIHADERAAESAAAVHATAYCVGRDVVFARGRYEPDTQLGRRLIAHELAHVVQQRGESATPGSRLHLSDPADAHERQAADASARVEMAPWLVGAPLAMATSIPAMGTLARATDGGEEKQGPQETDSSDGVRGVESGAGSEALTGLCIRTPFRPGRVRVVGTATQLADFAIMPETGTTLTTPASGAWYDSDGFWYRHHSPRVEWFKVSDHCDLEVTAGATSFFSTFCCNAAASLIKGTPHWSSDSHATRNPF